jgi:hypothetical protein
MNWTHLICENCWRKREPKREPVRLINAEEEKCCFCGSLTKSGIYVRENPNFLLCKGNCK